MHMEGLIADDSVRHVDLHALVEFVPKGLCECEGCLLFLIY